MSYCAAPFVTCLESEILPLSPLPGALYMTTGLLLPGGAAALSFVGRRRDTVAKAPAGLAAK